MNKIGPRTVPHGRILRGDWGGSNPPGSGKHPPEIVETPPKKIGNPPRNFTDFQYSQLQFRLFPYDEIILTAKA